MKQKFKVNEELRAFLPSANDELKEVLSRKIQSVGVREPIYIAPDGDVVDGYTRLELYQELRIKRIPVEVVPGLVTTEDKKRWMRDHQLARRNLSANEWSYYYGLKFNEEKKDSSASLRQNVVAVEQQENKGKTSEAISEHTSKSARTIERAGQFADAVDAQPQAVRGAIISGAVPQSTVIAAAEEEKPLFCRRCTRIGAPVRGCEACKKLQDDVRKTRHKKKDKTKKAGSQAINWKTFSDALGVVVRLSDRMKEHYADRIEGNELSEYVGAVKLIVKTSKRWFKAASGKTE